MSMNELEYGQDPQGRLRFYGIYGAKVVDVSDPLNRSRIKVQVFQTTGTQVTGWAAPCLPITSNSNHPDHAEHTASEIAALLTTAASTTGTASPSAHSHSIPALTIVAKNSDTLKHPHKTVANTTEKWNDVQETNTTAEHSPHRIIPYVGQLVWVMFVAGDPEYPVWIGVQA